MGKIGNSTSTPDLSDIRPVTPQPISSGHKGGRRVKPGNTTSAGGPGRKEHALTDARSTSLKHKHSFRTGSQDARDGAIEAGKGPTGAVSPSALQLKTRRRGMGSHMKPMAHA
jgi:hypothetical protein